MHFINILNKKKQAHEGATRGLRGGKKSLYIKGGCSQIINTIKY